MMCEHGNESLCFIKGEECLGQSIDCQRFKEDYSVEFVSQLVVKTNIFLEQADNGHDECTEAKEFRYTSLLKNQKFAEERAQDMTNQHNKTLCDIVF